MFRVKVWISWNLHAAITLQWARESEPCAASPRHWVAVMSRSVCAQNYTKIQRAAAGFVSLACSLAGVAGAIWSIATFHTALLLVFSPREAENKHRNSPVLEFNGSEEPHHGTDLVLTGSRAGSHFSFCADSLHLFIYLFLFSGFVVVSK